MTSYSREQESTRERERERVTLHAQESSSRLQDGFTLIELLIVIAILAILTAAAVVVLSPTTLLAQARDSQRVADIDTLNSALKIAELNGVSMGSSSVVYLSLPDTSATCASYGLPPLPAGWTYNCVTSTTLSKTDGTGWIPVGFSAISTLSIGNLPKDPSQNATSSLYYAYATGNRWEISAVFESSKYSSLERTDGGYDPISYETGGNHTLAPFMHGLVGYWPMDESSGLTLNDLSGYAQNATVSSTLTLATTTGCLLASSCQYITTTTKATITNGAGITFTHTETKVVWIKIDNAMLNNGIIFSDNGWNTFGVQNTTALQIARANIAGGNDGPDVNDSTAAGTLTTNTWYMVAESWDGATSTRQDNLYINGVLSKSLNISSPGGVTHLGGVHTIGGCTTTNQCYLGLISGVRLYARALSSAEILNIYNAKQ